MYTKYICIIYLIYMYIRVYIMYVYTSIHIYTYVYNIQDKYTVYI